MGFNASAAARFVSRHAHIWVVVRGGSCLTTRSVCEQPGVLIVWFAVGHDRGADTSKGTFLNVNRHCQ